MADDIMLNLSRMREMHSGLKYAIREFKNAADTNNDLEAAIAYPDQREELRAKASDFEAKWDRKRGKLQENLEELQKSLIGIVEGWEKWDAEVAKEMEEAEEKGSKRIGKQS